MRWFSVHVTLRRTLVILAIGEVAGALVLLRSRADDFRERARYHAYEESVFVSHARLWDQAVSEGCTGIPPDGTPEEYARGAARCRRWAIYEAALASKYRRAAARPWFPIGADPPTPDEARP
jgi:hypothetical protein